MNPIVEPQALSAIAHQFHLTQVSKMTGNGRLNCTDGVR